MPKKHILPHMKPLVLADYHPAITGIFPHTIFSEVIHLTKCLATFKVRNHTRATWVWLLVRGGTFSNERVKNYGYQGKNQEKVNQKTSDVKHDVA
jgi:hypothetical protein